MSPESRSILAFGGVLAGSAIGLGAFGAHYLPAFLSSEALGWWQTAVQYQMWQAIGLVAIGAAPLRNAMAPARMLAGGMFIFSGSLYAMAVTGARWLGAVTPIGGVLMIAGWAWLVWRVAKTPS